MTVITFLIVCAFGATACLLRIRQYRRWFRLPAQRADRLLCRGSHLEIPLQVAAAGFDIPSGPDLRGRTVLLQLTVKAKLPGHLLDPFIEIQSGERTFHQYLERGAAGRRYLNLSPLFQHSDPSPPLRVGLRGSSMRWDTHALLLAHDPPAIENATVLVLAPHPDDAEIAAFGMYARHRSWVVTITAGEKGTANLPTDIPASARAHWAALLRVSDSLSVPGLGQVPPERRVNLVYPDGALESMYRAPARLFHLACDESLSRSQLRSKNHITEFRGCQPGCTWNELIAELRSLLELTQPDIIVCPHPLIDTHSDHIYTTVALQQAMRELSRKPLLFLYAVHNQGAPSYPLGPAESLVSVSPVPCDGWMADSLYSHPLEPQMRQAKYFAIEAMHATRKSTVGPPGSHRKISWPIKQRILTSLAGIPFDPTSFLRRAPRPNEIYYVANEDMLTRLIERIPNMRTTSN